MLYTTVNYGDCILVRRIIQWIESFFERNTLNCPTDVVADDEDNLYIVERGGHRIFKLTKLPPSLQCVIGCSVSNGSNLDQLRFPSSMAFDSVGNMYVADTGNHRIQKFNIKTNPSGELNVCDLVFENIPKIQRHPMIH